MGKKSHWPQNRAGKKFGENAIRYFPICLWCGKEFAAKRPDATTCSPTCRSALARYVRKHKKPPMFPFGLVRDVGSEKKTSTARLEVKRTK